jgi:hypothetical protein
VCRLSAVFDEVFYAAHIRSLKSPVQAPERTRSWSDGLADAGATTLSLTSTRSEAVGAI